MTEQADLIALREAIEILEHMTFHGGQSTRPIAFGHLSPVLTAARRVLEAQSAPLVADSREALAREIAYWMPGVAQDPDDWNVMMGERIADALLASGVVSLAADPVLTAQSRESLIEGFAKAMNAIEARTHGKTLDDVARMREKWRRHLYEAERLVNELADFGATVSIAADRDRTVAERAAYIAEHPTWHPLGRLNDVEHATAIRIAAAIRESAIP